MRVRREGDPSNWIFSPLTQDWIKKPIHPPPPRVKRTIPGKPKPKGRRGREEWSRLLQSWALSLFLNFLNHKKLIFCIFYQVIFLHQSYIKSPSQINCIKNAKNHFLLLKKLKNTESARLWRFRQIVQRPCRIPVCQCLSSGPPAFWWSLMDQARFANISRGPFCFLCISSLCLSSLSLQLNPLQKQTVFPMMP